MRKDPTEFRQRFAAWKNGELVYDKGIPKYKDGYESFLATLPDNQRKPGAYNTRRYWELNGKPKNFAEAIGKGMYNIKEDDGVLGWHANSVSYNENNDTYEFMKPNYHPTRWMELVYGYDKNPEFQKDWKVQYNGPMLSDRYVRREKPGLKVKGGQLPRFAMGTEGDDIEELIRKRLEQRSDNTSVQRQEPVQPIKRNFIAEATRKHAAEAVGPDTRSSYQRKQSQTAKLYANLLYLKAKDDAKRAEGLEQMMKTVSPSTYIEAATGQDLGETGRFVADAAVFGSGNLLKNAISNTIKTQYRNYVVKNALKKEIDANGIISAYNRNPIIKDIGPLSFYLDYLNTVFPNSKLHGILWHVGPKGILELKSSTGNIWNTNPGARGIYTSPDKSYPESIRRFTTERLENTSLPTHMRRNLFGGWKHANEEYTDMYPVLVNTLNPFITSGTWTWGLGDKKANELFLIYDGIINNGTKWYLNVHSMPETIVPNSNQTLILGSLSDVNGFRLFMDKKRILMRKQLSKDGYVYKNGGITPGEYKYYGRKPNYNEPKLDQLTDYLLDDMLGDYIGNGAERTVYQDLRSNNRILKITDGGAENVQITDIKKLPGYVEESLLINLLPGVPKMAYEGFIKDGDRYLPVFSQDKVTPIKKVADPFEAFTKQYILPNGKKPQGKLSAIRKMDPEKAFRPLGYNPIIGKPGYYTVDGFPYTITDLGLKNIGLDALGNIKIFDPMIE